MASVLVDTMEEMIDCRVSLCACVPPLGSNVHTRYLYIHVLSLGFRSSLFSVIRLYRQLIVWDDQLCVMQLH